MKARTIVRLVAAAVVCALLVSSRTRTHFHFYPFVVNGVMLALFGGSFFTGTPIIERFARATEPNLSPRGVRYCSRLTMVWCGFFLFNIIVSTILLRGRAESAWGWYNGCVSYILGAILFFGERSVRPFVRGAAVVALTASFSPVARADDAASVLARLREIPAVRADFLEIRRYPGLSKPVEAAGTFLYVRERGVVWRFSAPEKRVLVATPRAISEGADPAHMTAKTTPGADFTKLVLELLSGRDNAVSRAVFTEREPGWCMTLPPPEALEGIIESIELCGAELIEELTTRTADGQILVTRFSRPVVERAPLGAEDEALLGTP